MKKIILLIMISLSYAVEVKPLYIDHTPHNNFAVIRGLLFSHTKADFYLMTCNPDKNGEFVMIFGQEEQGQLKVSKHTVTIQDFSEEKFLIYELHDFKNCKMTLSKSSSIPLDGVIYQKIVQSICKHSETATRDKDNLVRFNEPILDGPMHVEIYAYRDDQLFSCYTIDNTYEGILNSLSLLIDTKSEFIRKQCFEHLNKCLEAK